MSKVLAKFRLAQLDTPTWAPEGSVSVQFQGVQGEPFGPATPSAYASMLIHNAEAAQVFKDAYKAYVDECIAVRDRRDAGDSTAQYPSQPEFYVTFELDDGTGAD
jgi:hypothetical protein